MILTKTVKVIISNQGKYFASLGYKNIKQGTTIRVPVKHLPLQSNKIVKCKCDNCGIKFERQYQLLNKPGKLYGIKHFCKSCKHDFVNKNMDVTNMIKARKLAIGDKHPRWNPNKDAYKAYQYKVQRITEQTYVQYENEINPYKYPRTICGVQGGYQLDHKISIYKGFTFGINPAVIGSKDNLQMLPWLDNLVKSA